MPHNDGVSGHLARAGWWCEPLSVYRNLQNTCNTHIIIPFCLPYMEYSYLQTTTHLHTQYMYISAPVGWGNPSLVSHTPVACETRGIPRINTCMVQHMMATSCESKRTSAYSENIRWRMVYQVKALKKSCCEVARSLNVDASKVCRVTGLFDRTGDVSPKAHSANPGTAKLTEIDKFIILELAIDKPGIYLREIQEQLHSETGTEVDMSTVCRFLHASGFTRQKLIITAKQRSEFLRAQYLIDMQVYRGHPELLAFVDETGTDRRDCMRRFGYSLCGKPARAQKL